MARTARISTTVTARYSPAPGVRDAFWLDGRLSGRREARAADITLDREDRGAFFAVFARPAPAGDAEADAAALRRTLERMDNEVKRTGRNIDTEINELADCAVEVCGRISLSQEGVRSPYFAGIIVKDNEVAAVTLGGGCAYLYRGDALYPLTGDDFELEPVDALGNVVHNLEAYCAGTAGTVRYSNIAPLLPDDCLVVCNREVMETLGQKEVLRLLYEAEDQCDAAGLIATSAAAKAPGLPIQFMIGFTEAVNSGERGLRPAAGRPERIGASASYAAAGAAAAAGAEGAEGADDAPTDGVYRGPSEVPAVATKRTAPPPPRPDRFRSGARRRPAIDPRTIALVIVVIGISVGAVFALLRILDFGGNPSPTATPSAGPTAEATLEPTGEGTPSAEATPTKSDELATPTPDPATPTGSAETYTVKAGDTLWAICIKFYGKYSETLAQGILDANAEQYPTFTSADKIQKGWVLTIPPQQ